jgi:hypothetical protein
MKTTIRSFGLALVVIGLTMTGSAKENFTSWKAIKNPDVAAQLKLFVAQKQAQADAATNEAAPGFSPFFAAAKGGDWLAVSNDFADFSHHAGQYEHSGKTDERLRGTKWQATMEIWGTFEAFGVGDEKYSAAYADNIINSIPPGSIYFGGTDPGRFLITGMEKSQVNADPFFLLTQNALADSTYLDYLHSMYGDKIYVPTAEDQQKSFKKFAQSKLIRSTNGRVVISGAADVMDINGLIAQIVFDKNLDREFYIEESFPLDWMYPYLEPHGLIMKINREPLPELSDEIVQRDHDYWTKMIQPMIGNWLNEETSVQEVTNFAKKVFLRHDLSGFTGDPQFVQNDYSCKMFSKERANIADLYVWRMNHAASSPEKERMTREADFAYRQALALCPYSPEAASGYANFLKSQNRNSNADLVNETAKQFPPQK